jgi:GAF domain
VEPRTSSTPLIEHRADRQAEHLLRGVTEALPALARDLNATLLAGPQSRADKRRALNERLLHALTTLTPDARVRAALFWFDDGELRADELRDGWPEPPPVPDPTSRRYALVLETLRDQPRTVWVRDLVAEPGHPAAPFALGASCRSLVVCPIRYAERTLGFVHLESDDPTYDRTTAEVVSAMAQLFAAARDRFDELHAATAPEVLGTRPRMAERQVPLLPVQRKR